MRFSELFILRNTKCYAGCRVKPCKAAQPFSRAQHLCAWCSFTQSSLLCSAQCLSRGAQCGSHPVLHCTPPSSIHTGDTLLPYSTNTRLQSAAVWKLLTPDRGGSSSIWLCTARTLLCSSNFLPTVYLPLLQTNQLWGMYYVTGKSNIIINRCNYFSWPNCRAWEANHSL